MNVSRRSVLALIAVAPFAGCAGRPTRASVLSALVHRLAVPDGQALASAAARLALLSAARPPDLAALRSALRDATLAAQRVYAFRVGPVVESQALLRSSFWPTRLPALWTLVEGSARLDARAVAQLGVDVKGLFAIEELLYGAPREGAPAWLSGPHAERAMHLVQLFAQDVTSQVERAVRDLGDGDALATRLAGEGKGAIDRIVNELLATLETASASRIERVLALQRNGGLRTHEVQGAPSDLSSAIPRTWLEVLEATYGGPDGLRVLVEGAAPAIVARVDRAFAAARNASLALDAPLEQLVLHAPARLERAVMALRELEIAVKVDLSSALGVTLTFTSSDGD